MSVSGVSYAPLLIPLAAYVLSNVQDGEPLYVGKVAPGGKWLVQRFTAGADMAYANLANNPGYTTYASAWAARASLAYVSFEQLKDY